MARSSPTARRRRLGIELRQLRETAGLTIERVAKALKFSNSKISRIETGRVGVTPRDVRDLLELYRVSGERRDVLMQMAREAQERGWWQAYGDVPIVPAYIGFEVAAASMRIYQAALVPGLLQTAEYARAIIRVVLPDIHTEELERRVEVRIARQSLLMQDDPLEFTAVVDEAVFHRPVGGHGIMRQQLHHLSEVAARPNITLQVLPFSAGEHAAVDGGFTILAFPEPADPGIVYLEHASCDLYLESVEEVRLYESLFERIRAVALKPSESADLLMALANKL